MKTKRSARANTYRYLADPLFDIITYILVGCVMVVAAAIALGFFFLWDMVVASDSGWSSFFQIAGMILVFNLAMKPACAVVVPIGDRIGNFMDRMAGMGVK